MKPAGRRQKGDRVERELVKLHEDAGIPCKRVPLSGAQQGWPGDLKIADRWVGESKARGNGDGFKTIERWLGENHVLFLRRDRKTPLVVLPWWLYAKLMKADCARPSSTR